MVGRDITDAFGYAPRTIGAAALTVEELAGPGLAAPVSFQVGQGEIFGLFGLIGAGRTELLRLLFGATPAESGVIRIHGQAVTVRQPADAIRAGLVYCTEDRKKDGVVPVLSVQENCNLSARRHAVRFGGIIDESWERANVQRQIAALGIRTPSPAQLIRNLSGGNQQKVILGRWLSEPVKVLLLDEPTRGIDVGAKSEIYQLIFRLAREGLAVVVVSSDLPEVLGLADRVAVMREGEISAHFTRAEATPERVLARALPAEKELSA
jgi:L-arabinose transport system ATP-binding protein